MRAVNGSAEAVRGGRTLLDPSAPRARSAALPGGAGAPLGALALLLCSGCSLMVDSRLSNRQADGGVPCMGDSECDDMEPCTGVEVCGGAGACMPGTRLMDGADCMTAGGVTGICLSDRCRASACGDGYVDAGRGEECEDGNAVSGDGCEPDTCTFSCHGDSDCMNDFACDGTMSACTASHTCTAGTLPAPGTSCDGPGSMMGSGSCCLTGAEPLCCGGGRCCNGGGDCTIPVPGGC